MLALSRDPRRHGCFARGGPKRVDKRAHQLRHDDDNERVARHLGELDGGEAERLGGRRKLGRLHLRKRKRRSASMPASRRSASPSHTYSPDERDAVMVATHARDEESTCTRSP